MRISMWIFFMRTLRGIIDYVVNMKIHEFHTYISKYIMYMIWWQMSAMMERKRKAKIGSNRVQGAGHTLDQLYVQNIIHWMTDYLRLKKKNTMQWIITYNFLIIYSTVVCENFNSLFHRLGIYDLIYDLSFWLLTMTNLFLNLHSQLLHVNLNIANRFSIEYFGY